MTYDLPGDSADYHLLTKGVIMSAGTQGLSCEIGLRRGGGSKHIIDAISSACPSKVHIAIDPYGSIEYEHKEGQLVRLDYTNDMMADCMSNIYGYAKERKVQFYFYPLEDTEFFDKFGTGVPVYNEVKRVINHYSFVHYDGPHAIAPLLTEMAFFSNRALPGTAWVFDDVVGYYEHDTVERVIFDYGFKLIEKTHHKALYQL